MDSFKITGTFHERLEDMTFSTGNKKAEFVLELVQSGGNGKEYRDFPKFEVVEKFMPILNNVDVGDRVVVEFSVGGRAWKPEGADITKYFVTLKAWDVTVIQKADGQMMATDINKTMNKGTVDPVDAMFADTNDDTDLPF
jgi:hypothetical protein